MSAGRAGPASQARRLSTRSATVPSFPHPKPSVHLFIRRYEWQVAAKALPKTISCKGSFVLSHLAQWAVKAPTRAASALRSKIHWVSRQLGQDDVQRLSKLIIGDAVQSRSP